MHLATLRPTQPGAGAGRPIATGKLPVAATACGPPPLYRARRSAGPTVDLLPDYCFAHGLVPPGLLGERSQNVGLAARAAALGHPRRTSGMPSAIVRWPLTYPRRSRIRRSDRITDRLDRRRSSSEPPATFPPELRALRCATAADRRTRLTAAALAAPGAHALRRRRAALALDRAVQSRDCASAAIAAVALLALR